MTSTRRVAALAALGLALAACGATGDGAPQAAAPASAAPTTAAPAIEPPADAGVTTDPTPAGDATPDDSSDAVVPSALQFSATLVGGTAFDAATLAGKPTVFWFWAPT